jgi:hypothetical protein
MNAMMASLQRLIDQKSGAAPELQFMTHANHYLATASGCQVSLDSWTITPLEVELGPVIGSGGLYVILFKSEHRLTLKCFSGQVHRGDWNQTSVAIKVFRTASGVTPSISVCI